MSLVHLARLNGHDPYAYLRDVLGRPTSHQASRVAELLPHRWSNQQPDGFTNSTETQSGLP